MDGHHAQLFVGPHDQCDRKITELLGDAADVERIVAPQLTVAIAREIKEKAATRPLHGAQRHIVLAFEQATGEAQNALLKLFEDPPKTARFYISIPRLSLLLPTLRSRLHLTHAAPDAPQSEAARTFLAASYAQRLEQIAQLHRAKDTHAMRALIEHVERAVRACDAHDAAVLQEVVSISSYAQLHGASLKMLLEHLALTLPERRTD